MYKSACFQQNFNFYLYPCWADVVYLVGFGPISHCRTQFELWDFDILLICFFCFCLLLRCVLNTGIWIHNEGVWRRMCA